MGERYFGALTLSGGFQELWGELYVYFRKVICSIL